MSSRRGVFLAAAAVASSACLSRASPGEEWPQWRGARRDGVWREAGIIEKFDGPELPLKWSVPISSGYSGPVVAGGLVYVTDRVREPEEVERVHCIDWESGDEVWSYSYGAEYGGMSYPAGPRASVLVDDGRAFSLGTMGHVHAFDARSGQVLWKKDLEKEYSARIPDWGMAASPVVEGSSIIVPVGGPDDACVVAFDKTSGDERWRALPDPITYAAPITIEQAGRRVVVCWTAHRIAGLDARTGGLRWSFPFRFEKWPIAIATPVADRDLVLFSEAHKGSLLLRLLSDPPGVEEVWHRRRDGGEKAGALHCLISTPSIRDGLAYGVDGEGVLRCLDLETGEQVWEDSRVVPKKRWAGAHLVRQGERFWIFNERGELIIARLSPAGFEEISRAQLIEPTMHQLRRRGGVVWSHPAFAYRHVFVRNDERLVCADLSAPGEDPTRQEGRTAEEGGTR